MSTTVELLAPQEALAPPAAPPLNEAVWQAWVAKGHAEDRHARATFVKGVKWVAIAGLLTAAGFGSNLGPFDVVIRFIVAAGALVVMVQAFHARHYPFAALVRNACAPLQSGGARVQFFGRLATGPRGSHRNPVRRVTGLAQSEKGAA